MFDKFAIFICTNGRPNRQTTFRYLREQGYTGQIYFVLDNMDITIQQYIDNFGANNIIIFDKQFYMDTTDIGFSSLSNYGDKSIVYVKNAVEDIALSLNLKSFIITDDDLTSFRIRTILNDMLISYKIDNMDKVIELYNNYMLNADFTSIAFCGNVQYISGKSVFDKISEFRTVYSFVFRNSAHKVRWKGLFGEDIITAISYGSIGNKSLSVPFVQFDTPTPGTSTGGMATIYSSIDKFTKEFSMFIHAPTKLKIVNRKNGVKACILKDNTYPKIISARYKQEV